MTWTCPPSVPQREYADPIDSAAAAEADLHKPICKHLGRLGVQLRAAVHPSPIDVERADLTFLTEDSRSRRAALDFERLNLRQMHVSL